MKTINSILCYGLVLMLIGCAGANKDELAATDDLQAVVAEVASLKQAADVDQAELLSYKEYRKGAEFFGKAQRGLEDSYQADYIRQNAAWARGQLQAALKNSRERTPNAVRILEARNSALKAGLKSNPELTAALLKVDADVRDETDNFVRALEPAEFSEFQKKYFALEVRAVQFRELGEVKKAIEKAADEDARKLAPNSLRTAMLDVIEAENLIAQGPRDPGVYREIVDLAIESSVFLTEVMSVIADAGEIPENVAVKIVDQNRKLAALSENVGNLQQNLKTTEGSLKQKEAALKSTQSSLQETESALLLQNQQLEQTSTQVRFQRAMDQAVQQFSDDEASVYQQGSKLIFRLKKINFRSGSATIPAASKPLLSKINDIIKNIGAELVAVEGHTDSVGAADLNKNLSTKRAISVANYLASLAGGYKIGYVGYGESRPIASNETKEGRAINRRVDLVVTAKK